MLGKKAGAIGACVGKKIGGIAPGEFGGVLDEPGVVVGIGLAERPIYVTGCVDVCDFDCCAVG